MNEYTEHFTTATDESVADLLKDLREESLNLVRQQVELAKQETVEKVSTLGRNSIYMIAGGLVAYTGAIFLLLGLTFLGSWALIQAGISQTASICIISLIVGAIVAGVGYFLIQKAISTFKHTSVVPEKTVNSLKEDRTWLTHKRQ
jgi:pheromone shutdown protein TraB